MPDHGPHEGPQNLPPDMQALVERGACVYDGEPCAGALMLLTDLAFMGAALPFRIDGPRPFIGFWTATEAGHAWVTSVHPDDRVVMAWELGRRLLDPDNDHAALMART